MQLEYFLWPLEINTYLYKTDVEKVKILNHQTASATQTNLARWSDKSILWGSIFTAVTFLSATVVASLSDEALSFVMLPWFYVINFGAYAAQNWLFYFYLNKIGQNEIFIAE